LVAYLLIRKLPVLIWATFAARETPHSSKAFGRLLHSQEIFEHDRMNCMRHFSISHYFAKLDYMHVRLTLNDAAHRPLSWWSRRAMSKAVRVSSRWASGPCLLDAVLSPRKSVARRFEILRCAKKSALFWVIVGSILFCFCSLIF